MGVIEPESHASATQPLTSPADTAQRPKGDPVKGLASMVRLISFGQLVAGALESSRASAAVDGGDTPDYPNTAAEGRIVRGLGGAIAFFGFVLMLAVAKPAEKVLRALFTLGICLFGANVAVCAISADGCRDGVASASHAASALVLLNLMFLASLHKQVHLRGRPYAFAEAHDGYNSTPAYSDNVKVPMGGQQPVYSGPVSYGGGAVPASPYGAANTPPNAGGGYYATAPPAPSAPPAYAVSGDQRSYL